MTFGRFSRAALLTLTLGAAGIAVPVFDIPVRAQQTDDRTLADQFEKQGKMDQALPYLERLAKANPLDGEILFRYGFALNAVWIKAATPEEMKRIRQKARKVMLEAKAAGFRHPVLESILQSIPEDGSGGMDALSPVPQADKAMREAEKAFASGNFDSAIEQYQQALKFDPTLYIAALYTGDAYFKKGVKSRPETPERTEAFKQAETWFAKAIDLDPDQETAYRYWGSALLESNRLEEAKAKVVEAYVVNPYTQLSPQGIIRWAQATGAKVGHPNLNQPKSDVRPGQGKDGKPQVNINLDPSMLEGKDGRSAWMLFDLSRALYIGEMFKKDHPGESEYRHSLAEEMYAYKAVINSLQEDLKKGEVKENKLDPGLRTLLELDKAGLLESYILMARADRGIVQDFVAYRKTSRDKLRRYVLQFVIAKK